MSVILVLGGAGYIGSHACKALAAAGHTPVVYDNLVFGHRWAVRWGPLEEGQLADRARLDDVLQRWRPVGAGLKRGSLSNRRGPRRLGRTSHCADRRMPALACQCPDKRRAHEAGSAGNEYFQFFDQTVRLM